MPTEIVMARGGAALRDGADDIRVFRRWPMVTKKGARDSHTVVKSSPRSAPVKNTIGRAVRLFSRYAKGGRPTTSQRLSRRRHQSQKTSRRRRNMSKGNPGADSSSPVTEDLIGTATQQ